MAVWAKRLDSWCSWRSLIHLSSTSVLALSARAFWYDGCTGRICGGVDLAAFIFNICGLGYRGVWTLMACRMAVGGLLMMEEIGSSWLYERLVSV